MDFFSHVKSFKSAKSPLPVDVHGSKWSLLSSHLSTILVPKKWEIVQCTIYGEPLEAVDHHKYLGVEISSDLNCWNYRQIKANRSLGFISKSPENVKQQAYLAIVRPQLEYMDVAHGIRTFKNR